MRVQVLAAACALALAATHTAPSRAAEFVFDEDINRDLARKLNVPVFFTVPASARLKLPKSIDTSDKLIDFQHPEGAAANVGLRVVVARRDGFARRMAKSGLIQSGDILLTFRPEWGGGGAYPNIQMGISHAGAAFMRNGEVRQIDNPLNAEYNGANLKGDFNNAHYKDIKFMHVIRPRDLSTAQRANIDKWAARFLDNAKAIYPSEFEFTKAYNSPRYKPGKPLDFVKEIGQIGLRQSHAEHLALYCSEFAWSLLSLRNCDPSQSADRFKQSGVPSCIAPIMTPLQVTGDYPLRKRAGDRIGLTDGPLVVIDQLKKSPAERDALIASVFTENPDSVGKMSEGHQGLAREFAPKFGKLQSYYANVEGGVIRRTIAKTQSFAFRQLVPDNYSPTSFLVDTFLPPNSKQREMDYVATIMFE